MHEQAYQLCMEIEQLPASEQQTKVSVMAADLLRELVAANCMLEDSAHTIVQVKDAFHYMGQAYHCALAQSEQLETRLRMVTEFRAGQIRGDSLFIRSRGGEKWCVRCGSYALTWSGKFEYTPLPSSRNQEWYEKTGFTLEEAFERANAAIKEYGE